MIKYFRELLATLKSIDRHLEKLSSAVVKGGERNSGNRIRVQTSKYDN